jgi:hypothetical protein
MLISFVLGISVAAPRLPDSPFSVSTQPSKIRIFNLTNTIFDIRILALSAVGIVAQRSPELATVDAAEQPAPGPTGQPSRTNVTKSRPLQAVREFYRR